MRIADLQNSQAASPSTQPQPALSASSFFAAALKAIISPCTTPIHNIILFVYRVTLL
jgi:cytochrome c biogenesis protein CcdA